MQTFEHRGFIMCVRERERKYVELLKNKGSYRNIYSNLSISCFSLFFFQISKCSFSLTLKFLIIHGMVFSSLTYHIDVFWFLHTHQYHSKTLYFLKYKLVHFFKCFIFFFLSREDTISAVVWKIKGEGGNNYYGK